MFTETYIYDLKRRSVMKKTLAASLAAHMLLGAMLMFWPLSENSAAEPEKQIIKLTQAAPPKQTLPAQTQTPSQPPMVQPALNHPQPPSPAQSINKPAPIKPKAISPEKPAASTPAAALPLETGSLPETKAPAKAAPNPPSAGLENAEGSSATSLVDLDNIRARFIGILEKNKEYPYIARRQNQTGRVDLAISLDVSGNLKNVNITKSSGFSQIDNAALALVRKVCPFSHDAGKVITMNISINYDLKG